ncbi:MAG: tetratricopeptide repeat protein [Phaeodactylibacter sp.]|nr:tetratricopeptide repeat protein [Phaeodactylibacter sp.]MCB9287640.1 tetratricopeptide repeat protein [Lewinellaceae bacterium]
MKNIAFITASILILMAAFLLAPQYQVAHRADYEHYLNATPLQKKQKALSSRIAFWEEKLKTAPGNFVFQKKLASLYSANFKLSGEAAWLHRSDSLLQRVNQRIPGQVGTLQSLAANAISRHGFREAESYIRRAMDIGQNKFTSSLVLADVALERGQLLETKLLLRDIASDSHFDYLIREAKLHDQSGDLDEAVRTMEKATALAKASGSPPIINWSLSNLADMYGHQGRVRKSYETYLEALHYNPADFHALKGIAWIAYSNDKNAEEAKNILHFLQSVRPVPEYNLLLAEIADYEKDSIAGEKYKQRFIREASRKTYGNMYKSYLCKMKSEGGYPSEAMKIAREEVRERPHPMSYNLLAWAAFRSGKPTEALNILEAHVIGRTAEPDALFHSGIILKENGKKQAARKMLNAALEASFELGPVVTAEIEGQLKQL